MVSPIIVGIIPAVIAPLDKKRVDIRFQNTGVSIIYLKKIPLTGVFSFPSATDYEVLLAPAALLNEAGEAFVTNSVSSFAAVSSIPGGILAIYETRKV